ncbi:hypothetical protein D3C72_1450290 [compost metagenome]
MQAGLLAEGGHHPLRLQLIGHHHLVQHRQQGEVEHPVGHQRGDTGTHRRPGVLPRVEGRQHHLQQREGRQAEAQAVHRQRRHAGVEGGELAVLEDRGDQRLGQQQQTEHRRHRDQQGHAQAPVQRAREAFAVGADMVPGQRRQDHRAQGHAEHAQRQFQEAIGQRQPGLRAIGQLGGDDGIQQQVDLRH